jgi:polyisoprenoid-binding protein YceI
MRFHLPALFLALAVAGHAAADAAPLKLDTAHSRLGFTAATLLFDVPGSFGEYTVKLDGTIQDPEHAKVELRAKVASIQTGIQKRDEHLRSADFFDAQKYPELVFTSSKVVKKGDSQLELTGALAMHGKTKTVTIPLRVVRGKNGAGVDSTAYRGALSLSLKDFGIGAESVAAKISLDDQVKVEVLLVVL